MLDHGHEVEGSWSVWRMQKEDDLDEMALMVRPGGVDPVRDQVQAAWHQAKEWEWGRH